MSLMQTEADVKLPPTGEEEKNPAFANKNWTLLQTEGDNDNFPYGRAGLRPGTRPKELVKSRVKGEKRCGRRKR